MSDGVASDQDHDTQEFHVGCAELPPQMNRRNFFQKLGLLETRFPGDLIPLDRVLDRWRKEASGPGCYSIIAPRDLCDLAKLGDMRTERARLRLLAKALQRIEARAVVFLTPSNVSPSAAHRLVLERFFSEVASEEVFGDILRVWQPDGLWQPSITAHLATKMQVIPAFDPLAPDPLEEGLPPEPQGVGYARIGGLGRGPRPMSTDEMTTLAEWLYGCPQAFAIFDTPPKWRDALGFARWVGATSDRIPN